MMTDTKPETRVLGWCDIIDSVDKICNDIISSEIDIDGIVGLSRGGLVPAVMIANQLNIPKVYSYGLRSYDGKDGGTIKTYQWLGGGYVDSECILIVDDIADRGESLGYVKRQLCQPSSLPYKHKDIHTCTICTKPHSNFSPTWTGVHVENNEWVIFPWEADEVKPGK